MRDPHQGTLKLSHPNTSNPCSRDMNMDGCNSVAMPVDKGLHLRDGRVSALWRHKDIPSSHWVINLHGDVYTSDIGYINPIPFPSEQKPLHNATGTPLKGSWDIWKRTKEFRNHIQEGCKQLSQRISLRLPWGYCDANYAETHMTANQRVDTCSYSRACHFRGNLRSKLRSLYLTTEMELLCLRHCVPRGHLDQQILPGTPNVNKQSHTHTLGQTQELWCCSDNPVFS